MVHHSLALGIDVGTSGMRAAVMAGDRTPLFQTQVPFPASVSQGKARLWQQTLWQLLNQIPEKLRSQLGAIALNGTSSTVLLCDPTGTPVTEPQMYNDAQDRAVVNRVRAIAPDGHPVISATSTLAKLVGWEHQGLTLADRLVLHQADWLAFLLHGQLAAEGQGFSDYHNALKLGYDVVTLTYPDWLQAYANRRHLRLPEVLAPGKVVGTVQGAIAQRFQIPSTCQVCAGTTDSIAAFLASGASQPGQAVTSLGSTLVLKLLSDRRVEDGAAGIYSHRLGDLWLVGGASNTGGAVLKLFFTDKELEALSLVIPAHQPSPLDYYPLPQPGERFPVNDPTLEPRLEPRPANPVAFLHGLLESMARIEAQGYQRLQDLGASPLTQVYSAGGGAKNPAWLTIRDRHLPVAVTPAVQTEAAYGSAWLAAQSLGHPING
jgi:sugar (pentulose or hexulose) kinase